MKNKKGVELAMNFVVMIILSIIVLALGIFFINELMGDSTRLIDELGPETEAELNRMLTEEDIKAAVYPQSPEIPRNTQGQIGVGFINTDNDPTTFTIDIPEKNLDGYKGNLQLKALFEIGVITEYKDIKPGESVKAAMLVKPPKDADSGTYVLNIRILKGGAAEHATTKALIYVP
ncbi:MAG: hypothetical protein GY861_28955 [bacterium]|nr:hypothetical protein [bacterium]